MHRLLLLGHSSLGRGPQSLHIPAVFGNKLELVLLLVLVSDERELNVCARTILLSVVVDHLEPLRQRL